ncbi:MAG: histidinol-phosphatase [Pirellulaceae bacterium]|nr:histidinol-phosphatase [Pirellulaceae bacterium]
MHDGLLYETHSHTPLCRHAVGLPQEYADTAFRRGFHGLMVTCHNPMPHGFSAGVRMRPDEFDDYLRMVFRARQEWRGRVDIRLGIEADYFPGYERWVEHQLQLADFQYVLGSIHPQIADFRQRFWTGDPVEYQRSYFRLLADSAETGLFDCLAHPDFIKNETAENWEPARVMDSIVESLDRIARTGVAMELNTSGVNKQVPEMNPFPQMLGEMHRRGIPVVIGSDAHTPQRVGDGFHAALDLLECCGYREISFFLSRARYAVPLDTARQQLRPRQYSALTDGAFYAGRPAGLESFVAS